MLENAAHVRLLCIEDDNDFAKLLSVHLRRFRDQADFTVEFAHDVAAAKKSLSAGGWDALLLDLNLPDSDGVDTLRQIVEHDGDVPIVVLTGAVDDSLSVDLLRLGAQDFISKAEAKGRVLWRIIDHAIERKRAENLTARLSQSAVMATYGQTAASVAHRLNNPLTAIIGNVSHVGILLSELGESLAVADKHRGDAVKHGAAMTVATERLQEAKQVLTEIGEASGNIANAARDLRQTARFKTVDITLLDVNMFIRTSSRLVGTNTDGVPVLTDLQEVPFVRGVEAELGQIILAVLQFLASPREQPLDQHRVHVTTVVEDDHVVCRFSDAGRFIEPEICERLLEPFSQVRGISERIALGLAIAARNAESMLGALDLQSSAEDGTVFTLRLPAASE